MSDFLPEENDHAVQAFSSDTASSHQGKYNIHSDSASLDFFLLHKLLPVSKSLGFCSVHIIPADYAPSGREFFLKSFPLASPKG